MDLPPDLDGRLLGAAPGRWFTPGCSSCGLRPLVPTRTARFAFSLFGNSLTATPRWRGSPLTPTCRTTPDDGDGVDRRQLELFTNDEPATVAAAAGSLSELSTPRTNKDSRPWESSQTFYATAPPTRLRQAWDSTEAAGELAPLPPGEYTAHIIAGTLETGKTRGTPGYKLTFRFAKASTPAANSGMMSG